MAVILGPPESQLPSEICFRRLLQKLQQQEITGELVPAEKLRCYVETLQEQFADIKRTGVGSSLLEAYETAVAEVAARCVRKAQPAYCRNLLLNRPTPQPHGSTTPLRSTPTRLETERRLQEQLTDEMLGMTGALKAQTMGIRDAVQARDRAMDQADVVLHSSAAAAKLSAAKAGAQVKRSSWGLCYTILLLTVVGAVFAAMVVYIKATHVLGYRATGRVEL